jgi:hypothetical protein
MKAILVIDMPTNCMDCPMCQLSEWDGEYHCFAANSDEVNFKGNKPNWCPLSHPLKRVGYDYYIYDRKYLLDNLDREIEMLKKVKEYESNISD